MEEQEVPAVPEPVRQAEEAPLGREPSVRHRFAFTGHASECFRIWIVNVALSVLTLGIYSAWATVRTRR